MLGRFSLILVLAAEPRSPVSTLWSLFVVFVLPSRRLCGRRCDVSVDRMSKYVGTESFAEQHRL